jgi:hypothetical protein
MMEHVLSVVTLGVISLTVWLLPKYLERRVAEAARGAVDLSVGKTLADHRHSLDVRLEEYRQGLTGQIEQLRHGLATERDRSSKDYGLFAERRNEIYAETYSLFEKARGGYASHFDSLISTRDFSQSPEADLRHLARHLRRITEGERESLVSALDMHNWADARKIANEIFERDSLRRANDAYGEFRSAWVLHALYFSTEVNGILTEASQVLGHLSVFAHEVIEEGHRARPTPADRKSRLDYVNETDEISAQLRTAMRSEMQPS